MKITQSVVNAAAVGVGESQVRIELERSGVVFDRRGQLAGALMGQSAVVEGGGHRSVQNDGLIELSYSLIVPALFQQFYPVAVSLIGIA